MITLGKGGVVYAMRFPGSLKRKKRNNAPFSSYTNLYGSLSTMGSDDDDEDEADNISLDEVEFARSNLSGYARQASSLLRRTDYEAGLLGAKHHLVGDDDARSSDSDSIRTMIEQDDPKVKWTLGRKVKVITACG